MYVIWFHLISLYIIGFCTGIILTVITYHQNIILEDIHLNRPVNQILFSSLWNNSWDSLKQENNWSRHLYLIRHGKYFQNAKNIKKMKLTSLGKEQVGYTGKYLNEMNIKFDRLIHSGMIRALQSAIIINQQLNYPLKLIEDKNLAEGLPVLPSPYVNLTQRQINSYSHKQRMDEAFRTYFHRAYYKQYKDTHDIIVFHANVLRYFICKVMQFPIEFWLNIELNHGSITQITILSNGNVILQKVGDSGFIPSNKLTV
ncbi:unnamed protein product [Adineta steineri]|uniref:Serine/threonine-protein phosphatase PGAM5, mitochondrial n=1 Tax=Adineta steineri TaxID=433720 RepID=A0A814LUK3_9BILA|nr:unnamed protein product [Adineta steineri]CAF3642271.1 unnamed protein product [Adineta steineri]